LMPREAFLFNMRYILLALLLSCAGTAVTGQNFAATQAKVTVVGNTQLNAQQRAAFDRFKSDPEYYGVFQASPRGAYAFQSGLNTLAAAELVTKATCEKSGAKCAVYAIMEPKLPPGRKNAFEGLGMSYASKAVRWLKANDRKSAGIAIAANGYWGYHSWVRRAGVGAAKSAALRGCRKYVRNNKNDWLDPERLKLLEDAGLLECKIIWSRREG